MPIQKTFDFEVFFDGIVKLFKENLNPCINEINQAKGLQDSSDIPVKEIPIGRYFFGGADRTQIGNSPIFIAYDFTNANEIGDNVTSGQSEKITLNFSVNIVDNRMDNDEVALKALLRYHRAIIKMVNKNQDLFGGYGRLEIENLSPIVSDIAGVRLRSAGVSISMVVGY